MRPRLSQDLASLTLVAAGALAGHVLLSSLAEDVRGFTGWGRPAPPAAPSEAMTTTTRPGPEARWDLLVGPFHAVGSGQGRLFELHGRTLVGPEGTLVRVGDATVHAQGRRAPELRVRAVRLDVVERAADGSWRVLVEGVPAPVPERTGSLGTVPLGPIELHAPGVRPEDLHGRNLAATFVV
ncbi:MAG TPA: hypothetical protein VGB42_09530, partial [Candidatus Thermoplasmatota archaeon]